MLKNASWEWVVGKGKSVNECTGNTGRRLIRNFFWILINELEMGCKCYSRQYKNRSQTITTSNEPKQKWLKCNKIGLGKLFSLFLENLLSFPKLKKFPFGQIYSETKPKNEFFLNLRAICNKFTNKWTCLVAETELTRTDYDDLRRHLQR